jgi:hypothetical protein
MNSRLLSIIDDTQAEEQVAQVIDTVQRVEWEPRETQMFALRIADTDADQQVAVLHDIPPAALVAGLRAMLAHLYAMRGAA